MEILSVPIESVHKWALFTSFAGALFVALGTGVTLWTGSELNKQSEKKIESARSAANTAQRDTEILRNENLSLQKEIEDLRTKRMELEKKFGPRQITPHQIEAFLTAIPHPLCGVYIAIQFHQSPEAFEYAKQFEQLLSRRNISLKQVNNDFAMFTFGGGHKEDVEFTITNGPGFDVIKKAFKAAGFKAVSTMIPKSNELPDGQLLYDHRICAAFIDIHEKGPVILNLENI